MDARTKELTKKIQDENYRWLKAEAALHGWTIAEEMNGLIQKAREGEKTDIRKNS